MRFAEALALEVKKVSYRGVRMSRAQRRRAATASGGKNAWFNPTGGQHFRMTSDELAARGLPTFKGEKSRVVASRSGGGVSFHGRHVQALPGAPGSVNLGPKAKRATGQAARGKRLAAMGIGPAKPSKRMKDMQRARAEFLGARGRLRDFVSANRRGG